MHSFQRLEALFEPRLSFVSFEHLLRGEGAIVGNERVHAVGLLVVGHRGIDRPLEVVAAMRDPAVCRVRSRSPAASLLEVVLGAHGAGDLHVAAPVIVLENLLDLEVNAGSAADARPRTDDPVSCRVPRRRHRCGAGGWRVYAR